MLLFVPYGINAIYQRRPIANWAIIAVTSVVSLMALRTGDSEYLMTGGWENMILSSWEPAGLFGHLLLHADLFHLIGNMIFLWVFGNAICSNMNNFLYLGIYILMGLAAGAAHLLFDGGPALGASGAINGVIGLALAVYPRDEVDVFYLFIVKGGTFEIPVWVLTLVWLAFDLFGAMSGSGDVAYFAHIGGLVGGIVIGLVLLQFDKIDLTIHDRQTLLEFFKRVDPND